VLADDHPVVRRGLAALLGSLPGIEVVGEAADGAAALRETQLLRPDVVVLDIQMGRASDAADGAPDAVGNGIDAARAISAAVPGAAVLMLTMFEDPDSVLAAIRAGARGYLLKGADQDEIARAIRGVASGHLVLGPAIADQVTRRLSGIAAESSVPFPQLTVREREILDRVASGASNSAIAQGLGLAGKTVSNHISAIFAKLRVATRAEAIVLAKDAGLGAAGRR
jgi:DNA-binding NarL/FixJ family response regulator